METIERDYSGGGGSVANLPRPKPGSVGHVISNAIKYLDEHGWCQFVARNNKGEACGHGSIGESASEEYKQLPAYIEVAVPRVLGLQESLFEMPMTTVSIRNPEKELLYSAAAEAHQFLMDAALKAGWKAEGGFLDLSGKKYKDPFGVFNDDPNTTVEDVKLMMKTAIELADAAGV